MSSFLKNIAAKFMTERMQPDQSGFFYHRIMADHFLRYEFARQFCSGKKVLDIACGDGYGSNLLCSVATKVIGVDINAKSIASAHQKYHSNKLKYISSDALLFLQKNKTKFDVIVSFETIEHIGDYRQFLKLICKSLNSDGTVIISTPNRFMSDKFFGGVFNPFHVHEFTTSELIKLLFSIFKHKAKIYYQRPLRSKHLLLDIFKNFIFTKVSSIKPAQSELTGMDIISVLTTTDLV